MYLMARMCLYGYIRPGQIFYVVVLGLYRALCPLWKGRSSVSPSTDFETMALHNAGVVYFTEYLSVLFLTCISMNNTENGARACVNSRYQVLFSPITERLGTRLVHDRHQPLHPKFGHGSLRKQNTNPGGHSSRVTSFARYRAY